MSKVIGIDISKQTFDTSFLKKNGKWEHNVYHNNKAGFKKLLKDVDTDSIFVMEASGSYYIELATYLYEKGVKVSVVNPLVIKRYSQMKMIRAKTDKKDAQTIANYAMEQPLKLWKPMEDVLYKMQQIDTLIASYQKQLTMLNNQLEAFTSSGKTEASAKRSIKKMIKNLKTEIEKLEKKNKDLAEKEYAETMELLKSIPGIGTKTAIMLLIITNNFSKFDNYKQLIAYVGFSPRIYQSGTSVNGKGHINKIGNSKARKILYMASWSVKRYNKQAIEMYERLKHKGKPERVIKVAIANKLIKQAFAIVKSGKKYDEDYTSKRINN